MQFSLIRARRRLTLWLGRSTWVPAFEVGALAAMILIGAGTYLLLTGGVPGQKLLTPPLIALLLVANLVPAIALLVVIGRRVAKGRAARSPIGGGGRLHVRLVAIFSLLASIPMLLVVIFASLLFQYGVEFWFSDRARGMLENASSLAQGYYQEKQQAVAGETVTMAGDLRDYLGQASTESRAFQEGYAWQVLSRNLTESAIVELKGGQPRTVAMVNPDARPVEKRISADVLARLARGQPVVVTDSADRIEAVTRLYPGRDVFLYASRIADRQASMQTDRAKAVLADYEGLLDRSRRLQLQFNAALFIISLLIVGAAVWIALQVADRLVRPVEDLVGAARRVAGGDLSARVPGGSPRDEVGTLANAFNRMTRRLEEQTAALERRRAFTETVLSGVSAGVIAIDADATIRLINSSGVALLAADGTPIGRNLDEVAPELAAMLAENQRDAIVELTTGAGPRTLAVKIVADAAGHVLTFDDITDQVADQRRAAWSDVARRIAHEIKNPLTPIQLAAERLRRRYGKEVNDEDGTFGRLTDTIVRQVGDLRRMVDEFSSFARMPKPLFRHEALVDIVRQALFLHEVAHSAIKFVLEAPDPHPQLVCDRRQLGQAFTNLVKNAVEAIGQQPGGEAAGGAVTITLSTLATGHIRVIVADTGVGLPAERDRLVEPYVTTRARGTGLGLAIVKKIVEEHFGTIGFSDRHGGGTVVTIDFDPALLAAAQSREAHDAPEPQLAERV